MEEEVYITEDEREKCRKIVNAFEELFAQIDGMVLDAGKYGFLKVQYYNYPDGFDEVTCYTDSQSLFKELWQEWRNTQLLDFAQGTPMEEMDYEDIFHCLPKETQREYMKKRQYFAEKAEMDPFLAQI